MKQLILLLFLSLNAFAYVQVNPTRFLLEGNRKVGSMSVRNTQSEKVRVEMTLKFFSMTSTGEMKRAKAGIEGKNLKRVIFSPSSFTVAPKEKQVVRFFIRDKIKDEELTGFANLRTEKLGQDKPKGKNSMSLVPKLAIAIPIIFRKKTKQSNISIEKIKKNSLSDGDCLISFDWKNKYHSSYINLIIKNKKNEKVKIVKGASNYLSSYTWTNKIKEKCNSLDKMIITDNDLKKESIFNF